MIGREHDGGPLGGNMIGGHGGGDMLGGAMGEGTC